MFPNSSVMNEPFSPSGKRRTSNVLSIRTAAVTEGDAEGAWGLTWLGKTGRSTDWPFTVTGPH